MTQAILSNDYRIQEKLGEGTFASVYRAFENPDQTKEVALKIFKSRSSYAEEKKIYQMLEDASPYVMQPLGFLDAAKWIILPYCSGGSLNNNLNYLKGNLPAIRDNAKQITHALEGIHKKGLVHGDLKLQNILFTDSSRSQIRLADLGNASKIGPATNACICTAWYRPPEDFIGSPISASFDTWSMGCCLAELYTGFCPFTGGENNEYEATLGQIIARQGAIPEHMLSFGNRTNHYFNRNTNVFLGPKFPNFRPVPERIIDYEYCLDQVVIDYFKDFLGRCLTVDSIQRMTAFQAVDHSFFTQTSALTLSIPSTTELGKDKKYLTLFDSTTNRKITSFNLYQIQAKGGFLPFLTGLLNNNHSYYAKIYSSLNVESYGYEVSLRPDDVITLTDTGIETPQI